MRKFIFLLTILSLVLVACAASAGTTTPFSEFMFKGFSHSYRPNGSVYFNENGESFYGAITSYDENSRNLHFVGKVEGTIAASKDIPYGTITNVDDASFNPGARYVLNPDTENWTSSLTSIDYYAYYDNARPREEAEEDNRPKKFMYNLFTSPDVMAGAFEVPTEEVWGKSFDKDEILPYVKLIVSEDNPEAVESFELSFVESGDWKTPVSGATNVKVRISGSRVVEDQERYFYDELTAAYSTFTEKQTVEISSNVTRLSFIRISYTKDGDFYSWSFYRGSYNGGEIDWGELATENGPLKMAENASKKVTIKIPANISLTKMRSEYDEETGESREVEYELTEDEIFRVGNSDVLSVEEGSMKFTQGAGVSTDLTAYEYSTLTFTLLSSKAGRTTLEVNLPNYYYWGTLREIHVGTLPTSSTNKSGLYPTIANHTSTVRLIEGKPYYDTAEFVSMQLAIGGRKAVDTEYEYHQGYAGLTDGTVSELYELYGNYYDDKYYLSHGIVYGEPENQRYNYGELQSEDLSAYSIWWEFPDSKDMNLATASLKNVISPDFVTTAKQLETFVPYIEYKYDNDGNLTSLDWKFVDSKEAQTNPSGVTNIYVAGTPIEDESLSGTIPYDDYLYFRYDYKGVTYSWDFQKTYTHGHRYMSLNETQTVYAEITSPDEVESLSVITRSDGKLTTATTSITPAKIISFDVKGVKSGDTSVSLLTARKSGTTSEQYWGKYDVNSYGFLVGTYKLPEVGEVTIDSSDLVVNIDRYSVNTQIIEGKTRYDNASGNAMVNINRKINTMSLDVFYRNSNALTGILHTFSGDEEIEVGVLTPDYYYDENGDKEDSEIICTFTYGNIGLDGDATRISWEFPKDTNSKGSFDLEKNIRLLPAQLANYKPYVKFNRSGLNVSTVEWYFVDGNGTKIEIPSSISAISVDVYTSDYNYEDTRFKDYEKKGSIEVNRPESAIRQVRVWFIENDLNYYWYFNCESYSSTVLSWDIEAKPNGQPFVMYVGDEKTVTLTAEGADSIEPIIGNSDIISMSTISNSGSEAKVKLKALTPGMTSITLLITETVYYSGMKEENSYTTTAREIWVAQKDSSTGKYVVPGLTDDVQTLMNEIAFGTYTYKGSDSSSSQQNQNGGQSQSDNGEGTSENTVPKVEAKNVEATAPKLDITSEAVKDELRSKFKNSNSNIPDDIAVLSITEVETSGEGDTSRTIPGKQAGVHLQKFTITEPCILVFHVKLDEIFKGLRIYWYPMKTETEAVSIKTADADPEEGQAIFYDNNGNEIQDNTVPDDLEIDVAAYFEEAGEYSPIIATDAEGSLTSNGGGCNVGLSLSGLAIAFLIIRKKSK